METLLQMDDSSPIDELYVELMRSQIENRVLVINEEISEDVIDRYVLYILAWNRDDKDIPTEKRKPIRLIINSPGGDVMSGQALLDAILQSKTPIYGIGVGLIASMAYHIYLACHKRYAMANSIFLQHDGEIELSNSSSKAKQTMKFFELMADRTKDYVLSRTKMTSEFYDSVYDTEYWMFADKAKELGVVEQIVGVDCDIDEIL